jgi:hypothetical protein
MALDSSVIAIASILSLIVLVLVLGIYFKTSMYTEQLTIAQMRQIEDARNKQMGIKTGNRQKMPLRKKRSPKPFVSNFKIKKNITKQQQLKAYQEMQRKMKEKKKRTGFLSLAF